MAFELSTYVSTKGTHKPALVVLNDKSQSDFAPTPDEGHAHLMIFEVAGVTLRLNVPHKDTAEAQEDYAGLAIKPELRGYFF
jgi:hypothetical protein